MGNNNVDVKKVKDINAFMNIDTPKEHQITEKQFLYHAFTHDYASVLIINTANHSARELVGALGEFSDTGGIDDVDSVTAKFFLANVHDIQVEDLIAKTRLTYILDRLEESDTYVVQFESRNKAGKLRTYKTEFAYIDKDDHLMIASTTDVTEIVRQNTNQRELISMALERLDKATRAKEAFFANMSHEIRTPLNAIVGMAEIAKENIDDKEKVKECCDIMLASAMELTNVVSNILDSSDFEAGTIRLQERPANIKHLVQEVIDEFNSTYKKEGQKLIYEIDVKHEVALMDEERLRRAGLNILSNAAKYSPRDGMIKIKITEESEEGAKKGAYIFEIIDEGKGIDKKDLQHVFEPFFSGKSETGNYSEGAGLGLSVVKNIAEAKGAKVTIESEVNEGTLVRAYDPVTFIDNAVIVRKRTEIKQVLAGKRALLVEDQTANRLVANNMLKRFGAEVEMAKNGKEAVEIYNDNPEGYFDLVLMDIQMPIMNGYEATRLIRESGKKDAKDIKIIAMTADVLPRDIENAKNAGMDEHIGKPIQPQNVQVIFDRFFGKKGA